MRLTAILLLISLFFNLSQALPKNAANHSLVAIFSEENFPYFIAPHFITPEFVSQSLSQFNIASDKLTADEVAEPEKFNARKYPVFIYVYGNTFPLKAFHNLRKFRSQGGATLFLGGVPFCHPCEKENNKWVDKIDKLGWEFVSHQKLGTGVWDEVHQAKRFIRLKEEDPLGISFIDLPELPKENIIQFIRTNKVPDNLGLPEEDKVIGIIGVQKEDKICGFPLAIVKHHCQEFHEAIDIWGGTTITSWLSFQALRQLIVRGTAYLLTEKGFLTRKEFIEIKDRLTKQYLPIGQPLVEPRLYKSYLPRSPLPDKILTVLDITGLEQDEILLAVSLQGLVNRRKPRVFLIGRPFEDQAWLERLKRKGYRENRYLTLWELLKKFRREFKGSVIYDPEAPFTINLATMFASLENSLIVSPRLAEQIKLPTIHDLRGKWKSAAEAYNWALDNLWPKLNHQAIASMAPQWHFPRDYLIEFKIFTFWVSGPIGKNPAEELVFLEKLLIKAPKHVPVFGWWQTDNEGIGEGNGVTLSSKFAKVTVCTAGATNLSLYSGRPIPKLRHQKPIQYGDVDKKIYISFLVSDGDNFGENLYGVINRGWKEKFRGSVPLGWGICPTQLELTPDAMQYFYETASENDYFICMDGLGYVYPDFYGAAYGKGEELYNEFLNLSKPYMQAADQHYIWVLGADARLEQIAKTVKVSGIFQGYEVKSPEFAQRAIQNVPVFSPQVNPWGEGYSEVKTYVEDIRTRTPKERPAFMFIGVNGFTVGPNKVVQIIQELGDEYVPVRPDELCFLYQKYLKEGLTPNPRPRAKFELPKLKLQPPEPYINPKGNLIIREPAAGRPACRRQAGMTALRKSLAGILTPKAPNGCVRSFTLNSCLQPKNYSFISM